MTNVVCRVIVLLFVFDDVILFVLKYIFSTYLKFYSTPYYIGKYFWKTYKNLNVAELEVAPLENRLNHMTTMYVMSYQTFFKFS